MDTDHYRQIKSEALTPPEMPFTQNAPLPMATRPMDIKTDSKALFWQQQDEQKLQQLSISEGSTDVY